MRSRRLELLLLLLAVGCQREPGPAAGRADPLAEARALIEQGRADEALARLQGAGDAEALYLQGRAWAKKAETAPLPTPPMPASPVPPGAPPPSAPEFKTEELSALGFYERALAARPEDAAAHQAVAELLAPHALARLRQQEAAAQAKRRSRHRIAEAPPSAASGPDVSVERVIQEYGRASQADPVGTAAVRGLIAFAISAGRLDEAEVGFRELLQRDRENPEPLIRYGDFLAGERKDPEKAIAQYAQALIWRPDDAATRSKVADLYLDMVVGHLERREYATAEARLKEAGRYVSDPGSPQGRRLQEQLDYLAQIRGRPAGR